MTYLDTLQEILELKESDIFYISWQYWADTGEIDHACGINRDLIKTHKYAPKQY